MVQQENTLGLELCQDEYKMDRFILTPVFIIKQLNCGDECLVSEMYNNKRKFDVFQLIKESNNLM